MFSMSKNKKLVENTQILSKINYKHLHKTEKGSSIFQVVSQYSVSTYTKVSNPDFGVILNVFVFLK